MRWHELPHKASFGYRVGYTEAREPLAGATRRILRRTELVLDWEHEGEEQKHCVPLKRKGLQWYMLSQLRDDLRENRLIISA